MEYLKIMIRTPVGSTLPSPSSADFCHEFAGLRLLTPHFALYCHCGRRRPAEELYRLECKIEIKRVLLQRTDLISLCEAKQWVSEPPSETPSPLLNNVVVKMSESPANGNGSSLPNDVANDDEKEAEEEIVKEEYWSCGLCKVIVSSEVTFNKHLEGRKHKRKEAAVVKKQEDNPETGVGAGSEYQKKFRYWCEACEVGTHSFDVMSKHTGGKRHVSRMKELVAQPWL